MSDIKLSSNQVTVEAFTLKSDGADVIIDYSPRRRSTSGLRRALVHNYDDGLTINWADDYPGGVTIRGNVVMPGNLTVSGLQVESVIRRLQADIRSLESRVRSLES